MWLASSPSGTPGNLLSHFIRVLIRLVSFFLKYVLSSTAIVALVWNYAKKAHTRKAVRKQIEIAIHQSLGEKQLLTLSGSRFELKAGHLRFAIGAREFRLPFPQEFEAELLAVFPDWQFRRPAIDDFAEDLLSRAEKLIPDLRSRLQLAAIETAKTFVERGQTITAAF